MGFGEAISSGFSNYANFSGRTRRSGYWWWVLFTIILTSIGTLIDNLIGSSINGQPVGYIAGLIALVLLIPNISITFRRLHDTGRSGWWWLLSLICCIGSLILFIFCVQDSQPGDNQYGPNPKGLEI